MAESKMAVALKMFLSMVKGIGLKTETYGNFLRSGMKSGKSNGFNETNPSSHFSTKYDSLHYPEYLKC